MNNNNLDAIRHSASHALAAVVLEMFPEAKLGVGPTIKDGFYYDFDLPRTLIPEDLEILESKMQKFINKGYDFEQYDEQKDRAIQFLSKIKQPYKIELVKELGGDKVSFYKTGPFVDLCIGPHVKNTKDIKAFKLLSIAGAYWKGDEKNTQMQRIYGTAFASKEELKKYLENREKAKNVDHRKIGQALGIFANIPEIGLGLPVWLPAGETLRAQIENVVMCECLTDGYQFVKTPHIAKSSLYKTSGHLEHYKENIYPEMDLDGEKYVLKPMNCPHHIQIFKTSPKSYKDLPYRIAEFGTVYRKEKSGEISGISRPRAFTIDDGHIFCTPEQIEDELIGVFALQKRTLKKLGFDKFKITLSTRGKKNHKGFIGDESLWKKAEEMLRAALKKSKLPFLEEEGEAAFYGPKADFFLEDAYSRDWQLSTIQVDLNLPERFDVNFIDKSGKKQRTVIIHRAIVGSFERFIAILLEHTAGALPLWLAPIQAIILSISDKSSNYAKHVLDELKKSFIRVQIDDSSNTIGRKIREAELLKIPYMIVVGEKEQKNKSISVRQYAKGDTGSNKLDAFIKDLQKELKF